MIYIKYVLNVDEYKKSIISPTTNTFKRDTDAKKTFFWLHHLPEMKTLAATILPLTKASVKEVDNSLLQGILTEGEGSIQLTSSLRALVS
jgi:hypothetical protein